MHLALAQLHATYDQNAALSQPTIGANYRSAKPPLKYNYAPMEEPDNPHFPRITR